MTDAPPPRTLRSRGAGNPAPRQALPRVKPLGEGGAAVEPASASTAPAGPPAPATGRDLLIPNGSEQARRKGRAATTVPTVAELMPPAEQRHRKKPHGHAAEGAPPQVDLPRHDGHKGKGAGSGKGGKAAPVEPTKEVELAVVLSKGLRKRLKVKAAELGLSPEVAVARLVEVWVDG
jgi:hypothetical protein